MRVAKLAVALIMVSTAAVAQGLADMMRRDGDVLQVSGVTLEFRLME